MRGEHTLYRYWSIGVGPRYSQLSARRLVRRAWLTDWLLAQEAHLMGLTVDVSIWDLRKRTRKGRSTRYEVRWKVADLEKSKSFEFKAQADAIRAGLLSAAKSGVPFDIESGRRPGSPRPPAPLAWPLPLSSSQRNGLSRPRSPASALSI